MHIIKIIIEGFKSYRDHTEIQLDKGHNIIVGKNGSGKSNIFSAVQFILSKKYTNLSPEERSQLIYEDQNKRSISSYVEIHFDNGDLRFPIKSKIVVIKREITIKKDEYFLNGKTSTKQNIESLLESAGISRSNDYFIVQQGKVNRIIKMKETERLNLLKEVAGTRIYEDKRQKSIQLLDESSAKGNHIDEIIKRIEKRISELEEEKSELKVYQEKDNEKRSLETAIYNKERQKLQTKLEEITKKKEIIDETITKITAEITTKNSEIIKTSKSVEKMVSDVTNLNVEIRRSSALKRRYNSKVVKLNEKKQSSKEIFLNCQSRLKQISTKIDALNKKSNAEKLKHSETDLKEEKLNIEKTHLLSVKGIKTPRLELLKSKSGQRKAFTTKRERNDYLSNKIKEKRIIIDIDLTKIEEMKRNCADEEKNISEKKSLIGELENGIEECKKDILGHDENFRTVFNERNELSRNRKRLWKEINGLQRIIKDINDKNNDAYKKLRRTISKNQYNALTKIKKIISTNQIKGYYGLFGELFRVKNSKFTKSVEKVAGNRLFFHVVKNDHVASTLLRQIHQNNAGRVTIMPLNQLSPSKKLQTKFNDDFLPMISQLVFDNHYEKAMAQVFGKTVIARDIKTASEIATKKNIDAITLDGDRAFKRGSLSGGYSEDKLSKIDLLRRINDLKEKSIEIENKLLAKQNESKEISIILEKKEKIINETEFIKRTKTNLMERKERELSYILKEKSMAENVLTRLTKTMEMLRTAVEINEKTVTALEKEIKADFVIKLSENERKEMNDLKNILKKTEKRLMEVNRDLSDVRSEQIRFENFWRLNLECRREELLKFLNKTEERKKNSKLSLDRIIIELDEYNSLLTEEKAKTKSIKKTKKDVAEKLTAARSEETKLKSYADELSLKFDSLSQNQTQFSQKIHQIVKEIENFAKKIKSAGGEIFLQNDFSSELKSQPQTISALIIQLKSVMSELRSFPNVNKKAIDQFLNFTSQRDALVKRKKEQEKGEIAIRRLISHLDLKKDEVINRTFSTIAGHFAIVFGELVKGGTAQLTMTTRDDVDLSEDDEHVRLNVPTALYVGVKMKVDFSGSEKAKLTSNLNALSGGQQTIVALALIIAIQRGDPAPFYFLDEIDANLDSSRRAAVTALLGRLAATPTQIISTTFKPEPLPGADRCFVATFEEKMSRIKMVSAEEASAVVLAGMEIERVKNMEIY